MQYSQKNFMRIIGNDQKNNGQNFWEILERIIGKSSSIIGAGLYTVLTLQYPILLSLLASVTTTVMTCVLNCSRSSLWLVVIIP